jgi:formylglycine-generating enzyme required for sulfatase activity
MRGSTKVPMNPKIFSIALLSTALLTLASQAISIDVVPVGDAGNPNDSTGYGGVSYGYAIGKYEVTLQQYTGFLNAVGAYDTRSLYHPNMALSTKGAIIRSGAEGSYSYAVIGDGNLPVTYVSWWDAARFTNWLQNGQPTGLQTIGITETGAYYLASGSSGTDFVAKDPAAQFWIPSENEWYKAAYYQPAAGGGDADGYWLYPTQSNTKPNSRNGSTLDPNSANMISNDGLDNGFNGGFAVTNSPIPDDSQDYRTPVGAFTQADSYYGTFDQGGNVWEWNDAYMGLWGRGRRGGTWGSWEGDGLMATDRPYAFYSSEFDGLGFRVATVPEPTAGASAMVGAAWMLSRRRRQPRTMRTAL